VRAGLVFRVGTADETLPRRGITHLAEHLALAPLHGVSYWCNGWVEQSCTTFYAEGGVAEVGEFLERVTRSLGALPLDRLEVECDVLRTEAAERSPDLHSRLMNMRFGAVGHGVGCYREFGLRSVGASQVEAWARERFTAGNAVLWMTAPPPGDLVLELRPGERIPAPPPEPVPGLRIPSQRGVARDDVALAFFGRRSSAFAAAGAIANQRIEDRLRMREGLTYNVEWDYHRLDGEHAHLWLSADCVDAHAVSVRDGMQSVVDELAEHGATAAELERRVAIMARGLDDSDWARAQLSTAAADHLYNMPLTQPAELLDDLRALTPEAVARALRDVLPSELVVVPQEAAGARGRFAEHGTEPRPPVAGEEFRPKRRRLRRERWRLVLGDEGLSSVDRGEKPGTVRFDECVALIDDAPGTFSLKGRDATTIEVTPYLVGRGDELERALRARLDDDVCVPLDANVAELAELAGRLPRPERVGAELSELPHLLAPRERPLALAEARRKRKLGALLATDRRIVWMYAGDDYEDVWLPWDAVRSFRVSGPPFRRRVAFEGGGEAVKLSRAGPPEALAGMVGAFTTLSEA
jgi:zinc protease